MKPEWLASASLALAGVCLGLYTSQPVYNPDTEQLEKNPIAGAGFLAGAGMVVGGAVMAKRSISEPEPVRKVQSRATQVQSVSAPIAYSPQPEIIQDFEPAEYTPDAEFIAPNSIEEPMKNSLETAIDYTLKRIGAGIIISSATGSGKTTFLYAYLSEIVSRSNGAAHISVIDAKGSNWAGLEKLKERDGSDRVVIIGNKAGEAKKQAIADAIEKIELYEILRSERAAQRMAAEAEGRPHNPAPAILVIDEWVASTVSFAKALPSVVSNINNLFFLGREDGVFVVLTGQSHLCKTLKIDSGSRDNVMLLGLNPTNDLKSLDAMISDPWVIQSNSMREYLIEKLGYLKHQCARISYCSYGHILEPMPTLDKHECYEQLKRAFSGGKVLSFCRPKAEPQKDELLTDYWA